MQRGIVYMVVTKLVTVVSLGLIEKSLRVRLPPTIGMFIVDKV